MFGRPASFWTPGPSHRLLFFLLVFGSISHCAEAVCTWTDQTDTAGNQAAAVTVPGVFQTLDECKSHCETIADCVAIEWAFPECKRYTSLTSTTSVASRTYSTKTCVADNPTTTTSPTTAVVADTCTMTESGNTKAVSAAVLSVDLSSFQGCTRLCQAVTQCQAVTYSNSTCDLHTASETTTASASGFTYATKQCLEGGFSVPQLDTKGTSSAYFSLRITASSCKSMCLDVSSCMASIFSGNTCQFYTSIPATGIEGGSTYYAKSCPAGAQKGSLTIDTSACNSSTLMVRLSPLLVAWTLTLITNVV